MHRREVLKTLALGSALTALPPELLASFRQIHASLTVTPSFKALTPHQDETVTAMADLLIPATETPGAKAVRVDEFIDRIVAEWLSPEERAGFLSGLDAVDTRTQSLFQKNFVDATAAQQAEILRALGAELAAALDAVADGPRGYRGSAPEPEDNFYLTFRQLVLTGYFTSEPGFTRQLHDEIIPGRFDGCIPGAKSQ